ncbi:hypothetical protein V8C35DRAFT_333431 [Trichoderma chlorosporum]
MERSSRLDSTNLSTLQFMSSLTTGRDEDDVVLIGNGRDPEDFSRLLGLCKACGIPAISLQNTHADILRHPDDQVSSFKGAFSLGGGMTADVVKHVTGKETEGIVPPNTTVALKVFRSRTQTHRPLDLEAMRAVYGTVFRELIYVDNPRMSRHPNLIKLLFVGWEAHSPLPIIGMELGSHGSLKDIIQNSHSKPSIMQMQHLTIDIALGIHALHSEGFRHGDLKPENIIIASHSSPDREIIAKIGLSGPDRQHLAERLAIKPIYHTVLWAAPEVICNDDDVDWAKADIYSYGLIIGSLWASRDIEFFDHSRRKKSSCFLYNLIRPKFRDEDSVKAQIFQLKSNNLAIVALFHHLKSGNLKLALQKQLLEITKGPLQALFGLRPDVDGVLSSLAAFALDTGRDIAHEKLDTGDYTREYRKRQKKCKARLEACHPDIAIGRMLLPHQLKKSYFSMATSLINEEKCKIDIPNNPPGDLSDDETMDTRKIVNRGIDYMGLVLAEFIKSDEVPELKTWKINNPTRGDFVRYLRDAAFHGTGIDAAVFTIIGTPFEEDFPMRLMLSLLALSGSYWAMQILAIRCPKYAKIIRRLLQNKHPAVTNPTEEGKIVALQELIACLLSYLLLEPISRAHLTLDEALSLGAAEEVKSILEAGTENAVPDLLHRLSMLADDEAASLTELALKNGARLDVVGSVKSPLPPNSYGDFFPEHWTELSPLSAAIRRGKVEFARKVLRAHIELDVPPVDLRTALELSFAYSLHSIGKDLVQLASRSEAGVLSLTKELYDHLLEATVNGAHITTLECERSMFHGKEYATAYRMSLDLLLTEALKFTNGVKEPHRYFFSAALRLDDLVAVKAYTEFLGKDSSDISSHLKHVSDEHGKMSTLEYCVIQDARQCFDHFVTQFPHFVDISIISGCNSLPRPYFLETIAKNNANFMSNLDLYSPGVLDVPLCTGNIHAADIITQSCSADQLQKRLLPPLTTQSCFFLRLLQSWHQHRSPKFINGIHWLIKHNATQAVDFDGTPFWDCILSRPRPCARSDQLLDRELLDNLLHVDSMLPVAKSVAGASATIVESAVFFGHVETLKMLVGRGFNINTCTSFFTELPNTVLDLALIRYLSDIPEEISQGGQLESRKWIGDLQAIAIILEKQGCQSTVLQTFSNEAKIQFLAGYSLREDMTNRGFIKQLPAFIDPPLRFDTTLISGQQIATKSYLRKAKEELFARMRFSSTKRHRLPESSHSIPTAPVAHLQRIEIQSFTNKDDIASPHEQSQFNEWMLCQQLVWRLPPGWHLKGFRRLNGCNKLDPVFTHQVGWEKVEVYEKPPKHSQKKPEMSIKNTFASAAITRPRHYFLSESLQDAVRENVSDGFTIDDDCPPLHRCVAESDNPTKVEALLHEGAEVNLLYQHHTPISLAVTRRRMKSFEVLVHEVGALSSDYEGQTSLMHLAARHGNALAALYLKEKGLAVDAKDIYGKTPFIEAILAQNMSTAIALKYVGASTEAIDSLPNAQETDISTYWNSVVKD